MTLRHQILVISVSPTENGWLAFQGPQQTENRGKAGIV